ncbi:MAG: TrmB family transcriptional regulator [Candidatus Thorarchaeota archaeon]|nr:TrmB family transcriptional regulator [Candidatus Thorarchaeota archaeon]
MTKMNLSSLKTADENSTRAGTTLRELGFGAHETAVILALNTIESATVSDLADETGIHHANLYTVLDALVGKGFVVLQQGRPKVYQFAPLSHLKETMTSKLKQLLEDLTILQESRASTTAVPALIYTIRGNSDVMSKVLSMISRAEETILLVAPKLDDFGDGGIAALEEAASRGVKIRSILGTKSNLKFVNFQQRIKEETLAIDIVMDSEEAMISMPDLSVCGWADNPLISMQLEGFLEQTWQMSKKV